MKTKSLLAYLFVATALICDVHAGKDGSSPYFMIHGKSEIQGVEIMPLRSSDVEVKIDGTIARVILKQRYANTGSVPIEATYVFPASTRAAVHGMTLSNGGRVTRAVIRRKDVARKEYAEAREQKKTAALLEEHRPNVFQMSVANLLPGEDIEVETTWTESIPSENSVYEFVFPTVVGPRYDGVGQSKETPWAANPHLPADTQVAPEFTLSVDLTTTLPLAEVGCPSHEVDVSFHEKNRAKIEIGGTSKRGLDNRDFVIRWEHGNRQVDTGLLLHQGKEENHFMMQISPPPRVTPDHIPPRDYVLLLDCSGSMDGFPIETAKGLLVDLVKGFKEDDTFNVVTFSSDCQILSSQPLTASKKNLDRAVRFISEQPSGGGTEMKMALRRAIDLPGGEGRSRSILLVTDGYVTADTEARNLVKENIGKANLFTFGIGSSVNRELIESLARVGGGESVVVLSSTEAQKVARKFQEMVSSPVLAKVEISAVGVELTDMEPRRIGDLFAARPLVISGIWKGDPKGEVIVRGIAGNGTPFEQRMSLSDSAERSGMDHPALPTLWARETIRALEESLDKNASEEIARIGLDYSLLTKHTSFIAIDEGPKAKHGATTLVRQPLASPAGMSVTSGSAIQQATGRSSSVPEPGSIGLISFLVVLLALQRQRTN